VFKVIVQQLFQVYRNFGGHFFFSAIFTEAEECTIYQMIDFFLFINTGPLFNVFRSQVLELLLLFLAAILENGGYKPSDTFAEVAPSKLLFFVFLRFKP